MLRAKVSITKKRSAGGGSNDMFTAGLEVELPDNAVENGIRKTIAALFRDVNAEIDAQIAADHGPAPVVPNNGGNNGGSQSTPRNGSGRIPKASSKQVGFLLSLAKRNRRMSPPDITRMVEQRTGKKSVYDLDVKEASSFIDELSGS